METNDPSVADRLAANRRLLETMRAALVNLHKALVDSERVQYESTIGRIQSPNHFLQLVTSDPWFAWLSPLSRLIVSMDEALDARKPVMPAVVESLLREPARLLVASDTGSGFARHYEDALQRDPDVVMAHAQVASQWRARRAAQP